MELFTDIMNSLNQIGVWLLANPTTSIVAIVVLVVGATVLRPVISIVRSLLSVVVLALVALLIYSWL